ncbi:hypothetical protein FLACOL_00212 [Flavobacterium columnare]|uniref:Uncharacterized protein n=2 Tax=Flavobacterium TaxID=237 RepID=A0A2N9P7B7_9FLAO|nr:MULTISPECIES: hypothetical protein [Flavobacterium]QYS89713.1 hypothetical protein JJC05_05630 [Flavobacterium davisii]RVU91465.1 hypothetical protein EH230_11450 [Flavobacterium columnare]SPE76234.1 hypothetical protein FLACOL_00212 [Flavobacterium columnare]
MTRKELNTKNTTGSKGFYSLLLAFLLFFSLSANSISFAQALSTHTFKIEKTKVKQGKALTVQQTADEDEELAELDIDDEDDLEDGHLLAVFQYFQDLLAPLTSEKVVAKSAVSLGVSYKKPLYILYCNWKFHLS